MDNLLSILGIALGVFLLGLILISCYNKIDRSLFGKRKRHIPSMENGRLFFTTVRESTDYKPFGRAQVLMSAVCGVFLGVMTYLAGWGIKTEIASGLSFVIVLIITMILSYNLYDAIVRMPSFGSRVGKFLFLTLFCGIGIVVGVFGSLLVLFALVFYFIVILFRMMLSSPKDIVLDDGTVVKKMGSGLFGEQYYKEKDGSNTYEAIGDNFRKTKGE